MPNVEGDPPPHVGSYGENKKGESHSGFALKFFIDD
jgi:hypothetical protein